MITYIDAQGIMNRVFKDCHDLREAGQREYAHTHTNALANFERVAAAVGVSREQALFTYLQKHLDGISAYIKGHRSQREDVRGRINDAIVYLCLLRCMVEDNEHGNEQQNLEEGDKQEG